MIDPGTGGGTTMGVCVTSPSDQAGQIDNILTRLEELEKTVAQLASQNISANQLSDISQSVGWVYDVTYMGTEGWIQTAAGSLIPPPGVTWSSLGILPDSSQLYSSGTGVSGIGGGSTFAVYNDMDIDTISSGGYLTLPFSNPGFDNDTIGLTLSSTYFQVPTTGYYFIALEMYTYETFNPTSLLFSLEIYCTGYPGGGDNHLLHDSSYTADGTNNYSTTQTTHLSGILYATAGANCYALLYSTFSGGSQVNCRIKSFAVISLGAG